MKITQYLTITDVVAWNKTNDFDKKIAEYLLMGYELHGDIKVINLEANEIMLIQVLIK